MKKINTNLVLEHYAQDSRDRDYVWEVDSPDIEHGHIPITPNLECDCGSKNFQVCWWDYPFTGGYCKVICSNCGEEFILINDYA